MKLGRFIVHNMRNTFLEKSCKKCDGDTGPRRKKIKTKHIFGSKVWTFIQFVFLVCPCWRLVSYIKTCSLLALPHLNLFQKTKTSLGLVSCFIFSRLLEKDISYGYSIDRQNSIVRLLLLTYMAICVMQLFVFHFGTS